MVFGVGLDHFFGAAAPRRAVGVVRAAERQRFPERLGRREVLWEFECLDFAATERRVNAYRVRFLSASRRPRPHEHPGAEFLHLLSGRLAVVVAGDDRGARRRRLDLFRLHPAARIFAAQPGTGGGAGGHGSLSGVVGRRDTAGP